VLNEDGPESASGVWRQAVARARQTPGGGEQQAPESAEPWTPDEGWQLDDLDDPDLDHHDGTEPHDDNLDHNHDHENARPRNVQAPISRIPPRHTVPSPVVDELTESVGDRRGVKLAERLAQASHAYDRERYQDAVRLLRPLASAAPASPAVRELYGLTLYRLGRWRQAVKELQAYQALSNAYDQHPVLADCMRALHRYRDVEMLWDELRKASPSAEAVAEGRIVMAGALADRGDVAGAIKLLERSSGVTKKPRSYHLRQWYALADQYERAGEIQQARELFRRVASHEPDAFDTADRLKALR
jgi:tetratricopeptide (TPR) repeat protein